MNLSSFLTNGVPEHDLGELNTLMTLKGNRSLAR